jgi:hypothetical protein
MIGRAAAPSTPVPIPSPCDWFDISEDVTYLNCDQHGAAIALREGSRRRVRCKPETLGGHYPPRSGSPEPRDSARCSRGS